jgi:ferritin-like metal-binding protein YciE
MLSKVKTLNELFVIGLRYAYDGERKLVNKGLPSMAEAATSPTLRNAFEHHLQETRGQVARLEKAFAAAGVEPDTKDNDIIDELMSAPRIPRATSMRLRFATWR